DWKAAVSPSKPNGFIKLWVNDVLVKKKLGVDNDSYVVKNVRLGITAPIKPAYAISGFFNLDEFDSDRKYYMSDYP
ncbi:MAG: hypothetical protein N2D54_09290, partial [Chloroflexota bacterium]